MLFRHEAVRDCSGINLSRDPDARVRDGERYSPGIMPGPRRDEERRKSETQRNATAREPLCAHPRAFILSRRNYRSRFSFGFPPAMKTPKDASFQSSIASDRCADHFALDRRKANDFIYGARESDKHT